MGQNIYLEFINFHICNFALLVWTTETRFPLYHIPITVLKCTLKRHLCPVWLLVSVSSVTPAVENEVDSSSVPLFLSRADELSGCCLSPSASDERKSCEPDCTCVCAWVCVCVRMACIPTVYIYISECVLWVVRSIKTWYSNTCWVCLRRNALLFLGAIKWQQLAVSLFTLFTVNHSHKEKTWPHWMRTINSVRLLTCAHFRILWHIKELSCQRTCVCVQTGVIRVCQVCFIYVPISEGHLQSRAVGFKSA